MCISHITLWQDIWWQFLPRTRLPHDMFSRQLSGRKSANCLLPISQVQKLQYTWSLPGHHGLIVALGCEFMEGKILCSYQNITHLTGRLIGVLEWADMRSSLCTHVLKKTLYASTFIVFPSHCFWVWFMFVSPGQFRVLSMVEPKK